jgi:hypothetical protein
MKDRPTPPPKNNIEIPPVPAMPEIQPPRTKIESGGKIQAIVPRDIEEAFRMAEAIFVSGMYPDSYAADDKGKSGHHMGTVDKRATVSRIMIGIQKSMEVGLAPITGLSNIYIVNNRPTLFGDGIPALLYGSGKVEYIKEWTTGDWGKDDYTAHCEIKRKDSSMATKAEFSYADAKKAQLLGKKGPWQTHPKRQLQMRARGFAARDGAADILSGLGIYEEVMDIPEKKVEIDTSSLDDGPNTATEVKQLAQDTSEKLGQIYGALQNELLSPVIEKADQLLKGQSAPEKVQQKLELEDETTENKDSPENVSHETICETCGGKGTTPFEDTDPDTGEVYDGIEPCKDCQTKKGK